MDKITVALLILGATAIIMALVILRAYQQDLQFGMVMKQLTPPSGATSNTFHDHVKVAFEQWWFETGRAELKAGLTKRLKLSPRHPFLSLLILLPGMIGMAVIPNRIIERGGEHLEVDFVGFAHELHRNAKLLEANRSWKHRDALADLNIDTGRIAERLASIVAEP